MATITRTAFRFGCGIICLIMYFFVSTVVYGSLGYDAITEAGTATLKPIAEYVFGDVGSFIALFFLIVAMVLIIQTGFLGSSRSLNSIAEEGNLLFTLVGGYSPPCRLAFPSVFFIIYYI